MEEFGKKLHDLGYEYLYEPYKLTAVGSTISFVKDPEKFIITVIIHLFYSIEIKIFMI
jgi:hypothetical protein